MFWVLLGGSGVWIQWVGGIGKAVTGCLSVALQFVSGSKKPARGPAADQGVCPTRFAAISIEAVTTHALYFTQVESWRRLDILGLAVLFLCLPGMVDAQVYTIHVPNPGPQSRFDFQVAYPGFNRGVSPATAVTVGGWEVTVDFDPARCEIHCIYRRVRDAFGRAPMMGLAPPITTIRMYTGSDSRPTIAIVDPAGLGTPAAASNSVVIEEKDCIPGRKLFTIVLVPKGDGNTPATAQAQSVGLRNCPETIFTAPVPQRI